VAVFLYNFNVAKDGRLLPDIYNCNIQLNYMPYMPLINQHLHHICPCVCRSNDDGVCTKVGAYHVFNIFVLICNCKSILCDSRLIIVCSSLHIRQV